MAKIRREALKEFKFYSRSHHERSLILWRYNFSVSNMHKYQGKLKNPIHYRTGRPLEAVTIKSYESMLRSWQKRVKILKLTIRMLIDYGVLGHRKEREANGKVISLIQYRREKERREGYG